MKTWNFYSWKTSKWENLKFTNNFLFPEPKCCQNQYFMDISTSRENSFTIEFGTSSISASQPEMPKQKQKLRDMQRRNTPSWKSRSANAVSVCPGLLHCPAPAQCLLLAQQRGHGTTVVSSPGSALESLGIHLRSATPAWPGLLALMLLLWPSIVQQKGFSCSSMPVRAH